MRPETLLKKRSDTGVFCKFCEISENTFFTKHLWAAASGKILKNQQFMKKNQTT